jgi:serine/threonine-protein kinase
MGLVYRAVEPALERPVALKFLKMPPGTPEGPLREEICRRFQQEARSAAAIQHPGAVTIFRVGQAGGVPFIAMEWLEGETLSARLTRLGRLDLASVVDLAVQVLEALQAAHDVGVIHRDVKPANLVALRDGRIKVADFGIAQFRGANLLQTEAGVMLGTPAYAAPEQLRGEPVDPRSDVFGLGMVIYEALTGAPPFRAGSILELAAKVLREPVPAITEIRPDLPAAFVAVLSRALARERAERWPSAREMAAALRSLGGTRPSPGLAEVADASQTATISLPLPADHAVLRGLPTDLPRALAHLVVSWPASSLPPQSVGRLLARLLDKPIHAAAFSGGLAIGERVLLFHDGQVVGAIDRKSGRTGDEVAEQLPVESSAQLHPLPEGLPLRTLAVLAGLLGVTRTRQSGLDSRFVHLPGLAEKLVGENFDGVLHLHREGDEGRVVLVGGRSVLAFFSGPWAGVEVDRSWARWVGEVPVELDVVEVSAVPLHLTWTLRLRNFDLLCETPPTSRASRGSSSVVTRRLPLLARRLETSREIAQLTPTRPLETNVEDWRRAPSARLLEWLLTEGPGHFRDAKLASRWKYLAGWLPLVRRARLHTNLGDEDDWSHPCYDVATYDERGKVLHLAHYFTRLTEGSFEAVLARVARDKEARMATGDIGGVVLAAREFPPGIVGLYLSTIESHASGLRRLQENLSGYAGFVRVGPLRGYHLLLLEDRAQGFKPLDV